MHLLILPFTTVLPQLSYSIDAHFLPSSSSYLPLQIQIYPTCMIFTLTNFSFPFPLVPVAVTSQPSNESELQLYRVLQRANLLNYYDTFISQGRVKGHYETTVSIVSLDFSLRLSLSSVLLLLLMMLPPPPLLMLLLPLLLLILLLP